MKPIAIGELMCLLPIVLGMALRGRLPGIIELPLINMSIGRDMIVFGFPFIMAFVHIFFCVMCDIINFGHYHRHRSKKKEYILKALVPVVNYIIYMVIMICVIGLRTRMLVFIFGSILIALGVLFINTTKISLAKLKVVRNNSRQETKFNRFAGTEMLVFGFLFVFGIYLESVFSTIFIFLFLAVAIISVAVAKTVKGTRNRG